MESDELQKMNDAISKTLKEFMTELIILKKIAGFELVAKHATAPICFLLSLSSPEERSIISHVLSCFIKDSQDEKNKLNIAAKGFEKCVLDKVLKEENET